MNDTLVEKRVPRVGEFGLTALERDVLLLLRRAHHNLDLRCVPRTAITVEPNQ